MITFSFPKCVDNIAILSTVSEWISLGTMSMRTYRLHWIRITHRGRIVRLIWRNCRLDPRFKIWVLAVWQHTLYFSFREAPHKTEFSSLWGETFLSAEKLVLGAIVFPINKKQASIWNIAELLWCCYGGHCDLFMIRVVMSCRGIVCLAHPWFWKHVVWWNNVFSISIIDEDMLTSVILWRPFWFLNDNDVE